MSVNWGQGSLTLEQLKQDYRLAVRILRAEKAMRKCAFADQPDVMVCKVSEIERWQEELKVHLYK